MMGLRQTPQMCPWILVAAYLLLKLKIFYDFSGVSPYSASLLYITPHYLSPIHPSIHPSSEFEYHATPTFCLSGIG